MSQSTNTSVVRSNRSTEQNSEFLFNLLMDENKHTNIIDFIDRQDKASDFACVCVAMAIGQNYIEVRNSFTDSTNFLATYLPIYIGALENYRSLVGSTIRQILVDEAKIFYSNPIDTFTTKNLVSNSTNKINMMGYLDLIKANHSYLIILRDEIAFCVVHHQNDDYILLDPHIECCGILSKNSIYKYIVYDGIWDLDVHLMMPPVTEPLESLPQADNTVISSDSTNNTNNTNNIVAETATNVLPDSNEEKLVS